MHTLEQLRAGELCGARHLKLCENLAVFPPEILSLKETLEVLDLTGNQLSTLPDELAGFGKLRIIFCSENRFTELPEVLGRCPALTMVGFKANRIATVSAKSLPARLRWLILTDNAVQQLPDELGQCDALQKLMLAGNRLRALPASLANCRNLELLRIAANRIERFPEWLLSLPRLSWLAYSGNPFSEGEEVRAIDDAHVAPIAWEMLALGELLGQGASGVIHRATIFDDMADKSADEVSQTGDRADGSQVAVKLFKGAVTSDGLPRCEMAASLAAGTHPNLIKVMGKVADHPSGIAALVMELIDPAFANLAGPPSLDSCTRDVYPDARASCTGISTVTISCLPVALTHRLAPCWGILVRRPYMTAATASGPWALSDWKCAPLAACWKSCWPIAIRKTHRSMGCISSKRPVSRSSPPNVPILLISTVSWRPLAPRCRDLVGVGRHGLACQRHSFYSFIAIHP